MRRQHVRRQTAAQVRYQCLAQRAVIGQWVAGHDVTHQLTADRTFAVDHKGFAHAVVLQQTGFDFPQLNAEPTDFHLLVDTAQVLDHPVLAQPRQIATAVQARACHERVRYKPFRRQVGPLMVATRNALAAHVQLARHAHRQGLQLTVEHVSAALPHRTANGQKRRVKLRARIRAPDQRCNHGFSRAVTVDNARRLQHPLHFIEGMFGHAFTAHGVGTDR